MTKDKAIDIIFSSPQYLELMKALEEAKKTISPDEFGRHSHRKRRVIFLGGFIDRGPEQREVIGIVRRMMETGSPRHLPL